MLGNMLDIMEVEAIEKRCYMFFSGEPTGDGLPADWTSYTIWAGRDGAPVAGNVLFYLSCQTANARGGFAMYSAPLTTAWDALTAELSNRHPNAKMVIRALPLE